MLAVKIDNIEVTRGWAWSRLNPGFGVLGVEGGITGADGPERAAARDGVPLDVQR